MKNVIAAVVAIVVAVLAAYGMSKGMHQGMPDWYEDVQEIQNPADIVAYYGCPNSKRVKKLNLKKMIKFGRV